MSGVLFAVMYIFFLCTIGETPDSTVCIVFAILSAGEFIGWRCGK